METDLYKVLSWKIDNFSEKNDKMKSDPFSSGGCNWCLTVYPKGRYYDDLMLFLRDADPESLRPGWKRRAKYCFLLLNQSGQELYRSPGEDICKLFCSEVSGWGNRIKLTLTKFQDNGLLENDQLVIEVYMNVLEVVHKGKSTENDMVYYHGVQIPASQFAFVDKTLKENLEVDPNIKQKKENFPEYSKLFVGLIQRLIIKYPQSLSVTELSNAQNELTELTEAGFKVDWLRSKLEERKKELSDKCRVQQLHQRVKNVKMAFSDLKSAAAAAINSSFELTGFLVKKFFPSCFSISKHLKIK